MRIAEINRKTAETDISLRLDIDGKGNNSIATGTMRGQTDTYLAQYILYFCM